jgi:hypothetical protein
MSTVSFNTDKIGSISDETTLLDTIIRIEKKCSDRHVWHIHSSKIKNSPRKSTLIQLAISLFDTILNPFTDNVYLLSNLDIILIIDRPNIQNIEKTINKFKNLFSEDLVTALSDISDHDSFVTYYNLDYDYQDFLEICKDLNDRAAEFRSIEVKKPSLPCLTPDKLNHIIERLNKINISLLVRRQSAIELTNFNSAKVLHQEFFVSVFELQKIIAPDFDIFSNKWLFNFLCETFDKKMLSALSTVQFASEPPMFSLNMSIATMLDPNPNSPFKKFLMVHDPDKPLSIEIQISDIIANTAGFFEIQNFIKNHNHTLIIDGLNETILRFINIEQFTADLYKVIWSPDLINSLHSDIMIDMFEMIGLRRIILSRCDSEKSMTWGLKNGVNKFQGRFIDRFLAAFTMRQCQKSSHCSLTQCTDRHKVIIGSLRQECGDHFMLDTPPLIQSLKI